MLKKLFTKNAATSDAHPMKVNFAHHTIPSLLKESRATFLSVLISDKGNDYLRQTWQQVGKKAMGKKKVLDPTGLSVSAFKDQGYFFTFFEFPKPENDGEPYFGVAVYYPPEGGDWNAQSVQAADYAYFTVISFQNKKRVWELDGGKMLSTGEEVTLNKHALVEWIKERLEIGASE